jgi:hypothetical protein
LRLTTHAAHAMSDDKLDDAPSDHFMVIDD